MKNTTLDRFNTIFQFKTITRSTLFTALLIGMISTSLQGCFESNSETAPPASQPPVDNGGGIIIAPLNSSLSVPEGTSGGSLDVLRNDPRDLTITNFDTPSVQNGTVSRDGTTSIFTYTPAATFAGSDSFTYTIQDSSGKTSEVTVKIVVSNNIIPTGRDYFNRECGICHQAGSEDEQNAFGATDLVFSSNNFDYDISESESDQLWDPKLMKYYDNLSQKEVDGLRAYIGFLKNL